jgi:hypothetical protein
MSLPQRAAGVTGQQVVGTGVTKQRITLAYGAARGMKCCHQLLSTVRDSAELYSAVAP